MECRKLLTPRDWQILRWTIGLIFGPTLLFALLKFLVTSITKNDIILFATLMAIVVYTWKTWQLKDLAAGLLEEQKKK